jgi:hypothetical protein
MNDTEQSWLETRNINGFTRNIERQASALISWRLVTRHYKITVGVSNSMFFHIKAEGDSWEEVINQLTKKDAA